MEKNLKKNTYTHIYTHTHTHTHTHTYTYITESLWHTPETNPTIFLTSERKKKKNPNPQDSFSQRQ